MIFKIEDEGKKVFLHTEGLPKDRVLAIIQELQGIMIESYQQDAAPAEESGGTIEQMNLEPIQEEIQEEIQEKVEQEEEPASPPAPGATIGEKISAETAAALDAIKEEDGGELIAEYEKAKDAIDRGLEKLHAERSTKYEEAEIQDATEDVQEMIRELHALGAHDRNYKITPDGKRLLYQCYYVCPACDNRGKRFVYRGAKTTTCHDCKKQMAIKPSEIVGEFPTVDRHGNIYTAGGWIRTGETRAENEQIMKRF